MYSNELEEFFYEFFNREPKTNSYLTDEMISNCRNVKGVLVNLLSKFYEIKTLHASAKNWRDAHRQSFPTESSTDDYFKILEEIEVIRDGTKKLLIVLPEVVFKKLTKDYQHDIELIEELISFIDREIEESIKAKEFKTLNCKPRL